MTEAEWLASYDSQQMLEYVAEKVSNRKLRLFACACCRRIWHLFSDERSRRAVEVAERFADGQADQTELKQACSAADRAHYAVPSQHANLRALDAAPHTAEFDLSCSAADAAACALDAVDIESEREGPVGPRWLEWVQQSKIAHCIFGNPFRPTTIDLAWLSLNDRTIPKLAQGIYDDRAFDRLPILTDALEDAGCDDADMLAHCRGPGPHVRGCWVVDLLLGKS
jgi:hypothetical protein